MTSEFAHGFPSGNVASRRLRTLIVSLAILVILAVAVIDYLTPPTLRFYFLCWPSIAATASYAGRRWAYLATGLSAAGSALANGGQWAAIGTPALVWNIAINTVSLALLGSLVVQVRRLVEREHDLARTDFLTGLPNARAFYEALATELVRSRRSHAALTVAYLDIDDFKKINDSLGHQAGDGVLREIARTIRAGIRAPDLVARLGGDEFAILLPETGSDEASTALGRILAPLAAAVSRGDWHLGLSVGAVTCLNGYCSGDEIIRGADDLMYQVKQSGKNGARYAVVAADAHPGGEPATG
jgi:diguanylate cyclase (GGDEF)-like protein